MNNKNINIRCSEYDINSLNELVYKTELYNVSELIRYMILYFNSNDDSINNLKSYILNDKKSKFLNKHNVHNGK